MNERCVCTGCRLAHETGYDVECHVALDYEAELYEQEAAIEFQDNLESLGSNRYGNQDWFWNKPYLWKSQGYTEDEIPF